MKKKAILKTNKRNNFGLQNWLGCYDISKKRAFEGLLCNRTFTMCLGKKYRFFLEKNKIYKKICILKIVQFETSFRCAFFDLKKRAKNSHILNQIQRKKFLIKGRVLNQIKGGYSIGSAGLVGFLPKSRTIACKLGLVYYFLLLSLDSHRLSFVFLQKISKTYLQTANNMKKILGNKQNKAFKKLRFI
jgi:hypothetical protein